jgi:hypothetical protein
VKGERHLLNESFNWQLKERSYLHFKSILLNL